MKKNYLVFAILFFSPLFLAGCFIGKKPTVPVETKVNTNSEVNMNQTPAVSKEEQKEAYQKALKNILTTDWQKKDTGEMKNQILALTAPADYVDFHFDLVIGLELIEQGKASAEQEKIEEGLEKINQLKEKYDWFQ